MNSNLVCKNKKQKTAKEAYNKRLNLLIHGLTESTNPWEERRDCRKIRYDVHGVKRGEPKKTSLVCELDATTLHYAQAPAPYVLCIVVTAFSFKIKLATTLVNGTKWAQSPRPWDSITIKVSGSGRITKRNRWLLRLIPQVIHDTSLLVPRATLPYSSPTPPDVSTHNPAAHKSLQTPQGPAKTCHYKPPANYDDSEPCYVPLVDSAPELNESSPVVLN